MSKTVRVQPMICRACGGHYPDCAKGCPARFDGAGNKRTWYYFKAGSPELLDICVWLLHTEGIGFEIVTLFDENDEPSYRIFPKTDAMTYHRLFERYERLGTEARDSIEAKCLRRHETYPRAETEFRKGGL